MVRCSISAILSDQGSSKVSIDVARRMHKTVIGLSYFKSMICGHTERPKDNAGSRKAPGNLATGSLGGGLNLDVAEMGFAVRVGV
jgi:hypothetical protein